MKMNNKTTGIVLTACLSLSLLAGCATDAATPGISNAPTTTRSTVDSSNAFETNSLSAQAQAALATYHDVDASFHDTAKLSARGGFATQQLGLGIIDDDDNDDNIVNDLLNGNNDSTNNTTNTSANVGVNLDTNVDTGSDSDNSSLNTGINAGANVGADSNSNSSSLNTTFDEMRDSNNRLRTNLESTGSVSFNENGDSIINSGQLRTNVNTRIDSQNENDILNFDDVSVLDNSRLDFSSQANAMSRVADSDLGRLEGRGFVATAGQLDSRDNGDGTLTNFFGTNFNGNNTDRNIIAADRLRGNLSLGTDFMLRENGNGFNTEANRVSNINADGSLNVVTRSTINLDNGDRIEIFEERVTSVNGEGSGNGVLTITDRNGRTESFDLRTMVKADGSLTSNLDGESNSSDLVLREDASGNASLSIVGDDRREENRLNLDFNAILNSMSDFDFS